MTIAAGTRLGPYEILAPLGAGGMGEVYRARDTRVDRAVALKVLPEEFFEDEERRARFGREAKLLASLNHPGIAVLYSFEEIPGSSPSSSRHLLAMELVEGDDLAQRIPPGPLPLEETLSVARQIAEALEAAHEKGIVHRDLKPANVKITPDRRLMAVDVSLDGDVRAGAPKALFALHVPPNGLTLNRSQYLPAPDGNRFLVLTSVDEKLDQPAVVVLNWPAMGGTGR
jgi:serine/threonine protein kinase